MKRHLVTSKRAIAALTLAAAVLAAPVAADTKPDAVQTYSCRGNG